ncbi:short-chain dehydrogenase [Xylaria nigripes]|nr:short-chain dehydrogenase [Xylaria nigripes]
MEPSNSKPYNLPSDAVWFITGCSSGIGQALAETILNTSNRVVATARNVSALSSLPSHERILKLKLDVTSIPSIDAAIDAAMARFGRIDVLVNNAGHGLAGDTEVAGDAEARALMDVNFWGMVDATKRAIGIMRDENPKTGQQGGVILNISSIGGYMGFPGQAFYHASKFAMEGFAESLARELPNIWNIHLSNIEPGGVETNFATTSLKNFKNRHPAYDDPSFPANVLMKFRDNKENRKYWAEPRMVAEAIYRVTSRGQRIPIRVPLGADAYGMIANEIESVKKDLEEMKEISLGVGDPKQLESLSFMKK